MKIPKSAFYIFILAVFILTAQNFAQQNKKVFGKIFDSKTNRELDYVNVKVADTSYGTTSDKNGSYFIRLTPGAHKLIISYIGYFSDSADVFIEDSDIERNIYLRPSEIMTDVIEVIGEDPAYDIIRKAIKYKKVFQEKLNEYHYDAYTKYIFRSDQSPVQQDSTSKEKYPIIAVLESETEGYFKKPDLYKEIVKSKRETANVNRGFAIPYIVNFYDESVVLDRSKITSPLADDALDYYSYKLQYITSIDSQRVYKMKVDGSSLYPLFDGTIYIADSTFALMKVDLSLNESAMPTAVDALNFKQKFASYQDKNKNKFWLPTDIQIIAEGGIAGLFGFTADVFTIISNYELNIKAPAGIFDEYTVKVLPDAKKDSTYWIEHQLVKSSQEEKRAYGEIEKKTEERKNKVRLSFTEIQFGKNLRSYPLNYYHYNRVEGSSLGMNLSFTGKNRRLSGDAKFDYGFSDKKPKYEVNLRSTLSKKRSTRIHLSFYKRLESLSIQPDGFFTAYNTLMGLFDKQDFYDYYYATGYDISVSHFHVPQVTFVLNYHQQLQESAFKNTDYSFRKGDQLFRPNPLINDGFLRTVGFGVTLDPNKYKYIDYGDGTESRYTETDYPTLYFGLDNTSKKLGSTFDYRKFSAELNGETYVNRFIDLSYKFGGEYFSGIVPVQSLSAFSSYNGTIAGEFSFRTMGYREYLGDRFYYASIENYFGTLLTTKIPMLKKISLIGFFNAGRSEISPESLALNPYLISSHTNKTYLEAGFGIGGLLDLFRLDFAWRLNNLKDGRNFKFTLSTLNF